MTTSNTRRMFLMRASFLVICVLLALPQSISFAGGPSENPDTDGPAAVLYLVARFHFERGEYQRAITILTEAIQSEPDFKEAYLARAECYVKLAQYPQALSDYAQVMALIPTYGQPHLERAFVYIALKQFDAAIADLKQAIELMPVVPDPLLALANLYYDLGQPRLAQPYYARYLKMVGPTAEPYVAARMK